MSDMSKGISRAAFEQLIVTYAKEVRAYCKYFLRVDELADAATGNAFRKAWEKRTQYDWTDPRAMLFRFARLQALELLKTERRHGLVPGALKDGDGRMRRWESLTTQEKRRAEAGRFQEDSMEDAVDPAQLEHLRRCFGQLKAIDAFVIQARVGRLAATSEPEEDPCLTFPEIARLLEMQFGTRQTPDGVRNRFHRACDRLKDCLLRTAGPVFKNESLSTRAGTSRKTRGKEESEVPS